MKKYIKIALVAIFVFATGYSIHSLSKSEIQFSDLALENIQALANMESPKNNFFIIDKMGQSTTTESGEYVTTCTPYKVTCMSGGMMIVLLVISNSVLP